MKKILILVMAFVALAMPIKGLASDEQSTSKPIIIDIHHGDNDPNPITHRAPLRICVEAWYEASTKTISILYLGDAIGEANLYKDGQLIDSASEINTTFLIAGAGLYTIEIITDLWSASGSIEI